MNIPEHQLEAYKVLYQLENILRVALHKFMTEKFGENYFTEEIFSPFFHSSLKREINIVSYIKGKQKEELELLNEKEEIHEIWYLDYRILVLIIEHYWDDDIGCCNIFKNLDDDKKTYIFTRLSNLMKSRNNIAHNRKIEEITLTQVKSVLDEIPDYVKSEYLDISKEFLITTSSQVLNELILELQNLISLINIFEFVKPKILDSIKINLGIILKKDVSKSFINELGDVVSLLKNYNSLLKPSSREKVSLFIKDNLLLEKINNIMHGVKEILNG
jgi:hypothetical protein